jgi:hypothetical protein
MTTVVSATVVVGAGSGAVVAGLVVVAVAPGSTVVVVEDGGDVPVERPNVPELDNSSDGAPSVAS